MRPENREHACKDALVVYLEMKADDLWSRMQDDPKSAATRPNLAGGGLQEVENLLGKRHPVYRKCADLQVDGMLSTAEIADIVLEKYRTRTGT